MPRGRPRSSRGRRRAGQLRGAVGRRHPLATCPPDRCVSRLLLGVEANPFGGAACGHRQRPPPTHPVPRSGRAFRGRSRHSPLLINSPAQGSPCHVDSSVGPCRRTPQSGTASHRGRRYIGPPAEAKWQGSGLVALERPPGREWAAWADIDVHAHQRVHRYLPTCLHNEEGGGSQCTRAGRVTPEQAPLSEREASLRNPSGHLTFGA